MLEQAPNRPGVHYRLGRALLRNSPSDAANEFEKELALDPSNSNAAYELAELHRKAGEFDKARDLFASAVKDNPEFEEANVDWPFFGSVGKTGTSHLLSATGCGT